MRRSLLSARVSEKNPTTTTTTMTATTTTTTTATTTTTTTTTCFGLLQINAPGKSAAQSARLLNRDPTSARRQLKKLKCKKKSKPVTHAGLHH